MVSLIGKLEQVSLPVIFQRVEQYSKTGVLVVKQAEQWVELYFRDGRLLCVGPAAATTVLGERLVQAGVIPPQALQEIISTIGEAQLSETRIALTLMDLGYASNEDLRKWSAKEAASVLAILQTWKHGDIYFEDNYAPPADRLLVALTASSLLPPAAPPVSPVAVLDVPRPKPTIDLSGDVQLPASPARLQPQRVIAPLPPIMIDTTSIQPEMVLLPVDLSTLRQQNPQVPLTPEQWQLLTRADGRTSLQDACFELRLPANVVRQVAGELCVLGLVQVLAPTRSSEGMTELSPVSRQLLNAGLSNGYVQPGYAAAAPQPWAADAPFVQPMPRTPQAAHTFEVQSQWGNDGPGARKLVPGYGWVPNPQPLQSFPSGQGMYAQAGRR
jgi:hypothetical protein